MNWKEVYKRWISHSTLDIEIKRELEELKKNRKVLEDAFYKYIEFGTGGMRGEIGAGTNRMNIYTVRRATEGLSRYIESYGEEIKKQGVVIAYDTRHKSYEFAIETAKVLGKHGIQVYIFDEPRPTPELSFAVRYLKAFCGIVLTASHNPPEYNGYKIYDKEGCQLTPTSISEVIKNINEIKNELNVEVAEIEDLRESRLLQIIGKSIDEAYLERLQSIKLNPEVINRVSEKLKIVFTPLHGTSNKLILAGLNAYGFKNVITVKEQSSPDPNFPTVQSPNPEEQSAFEYAIKYGEKEDADLLIATDPDSDRLGVAVKNEKGKFMVLTGNQIGALMLEYILSQKKEKGILPNNGVVLKTIVTSEIGRVIASKYGMITVDTLTGFKFIGEKINEYSQSKKYSFQFGYEESNGYLIGDFVRDKDAVQAALIICEIAAYYKSIGKSLFQGLVEIFEEYGYYSESLQSFILKGKEGSKRIKEVLNFFRENPPLKVLGQKVIIMEDYNTSKRIEFGKAFETNITLPKSNVLKFFLEDSSWFALRPSGTEPKVKIYFSVKGISRIESQEKMTRLQHEVMEVVENLIK